MSIREAGGMLSPYRFDREFLIGVGMIPSSFRNVAVISALTDVPDWRDTPGNLEEDQDGEFRER